MTKTFEPCSCEVGYSIHPHGDDYILVYGRCVHSHGYKLAHIVKAAYNFEPRYMERILNLGNAEYQKNRNMGHLAE